MKVLRLKEVTNMVGISKSTIYDHMKNDKFPQNIKLSERSVGWLECDIKDWLEERIQASKSTNIKECASIA